MFKNLSPTRSQLDAQRKTAQQMLKLPKTCRKNVHVTVAVLVHFPDVRRLVELRVDTGVRNPLKEWLLR